MLTVIVLSSFMLGKKGCIYSSARGYYKNPLHMSFLLQIIAIQTGNNGPRGGATVHITEMLNNTPFKNSTHILSIFCDCVY